MKEKQVLPASGICCFKICALDLFFVDVPEKTHITMYVQGVCKIQTNVWEGHVGIQPKDGVYTIFCSHIYQG